MAARFAIVTGSHNWSDAIWATTFDGVAGSAATPTNADDVTINGKLVACTVNATTDVITSVGHGLTDGTPVTFVATTLPGALSANTVYYVRDAAADTFKVSTSLGGPAINITSAGTNVFFSRYDAANKVTINSTSPVCRTLNLSNHGILDCITTGNSGITVELAGVMYLSGLIDIDMRSAPTYTFTLTLNNSGNATAQFFDAQSGSIIRLRGATKKAWTRINGGISAAATTCAVDDATSWAVGDEIVIAPTETDFNTGNGWVPRYDRVTLNGSYTPGSTTLTWTGGTTYAHADNAAAANLTRNIIITSAGTGGKAYVRNTLNSSYAPVTPEVSYAKFLNLGTASSPVGSYIPYGPATTGAVWNALEGNVFDDASLGLYSPVSGVLPTEKWNVFTKTASANQGSRTVTNVLDSCNDVEDCCFIAASAIFNQSKNFTGRRIVFGGASWAGTSSAMTGGGDATCKHIDYEFYANQIDIDSAYGIFPECVLVTPKVQVIAQSYRHHYNNYAGRYKYFNPTMSNMGTYSLRTSLAGLWSKWTIENKDGDVDVQEVYTSESLTIPSFQRDTSEKKNADGSLKMYGSTYGYVGREYTFEIQVPGNSTATIRGSCKVDADFYNAGDWYAPTLKFYLNDAEVVSGVTNYTATSSANAAWEDFVATVDNTEAYTQVYVVKIRADRKGSAGYCWISGIPTFPFVKAARHYGYRYNETSPTRVVDTLASANEATASGYNYGTITWGDTASSTAITASCTLQQLYDWHQYQGTLNATKAVALTGAGAAGSPALFAQGNVTISDTFVLNGAGSISMGSYTLSTEFASGSNYTYTGGTWSQATTVPTFSGGTLDIGAAGTYTFTMAASTLVKVTPTAPGTYDLSGGSFTGTLTVNNMAAHAITVQVPAGTTTSDAGNTGGAITFSAPTVERGLEFTGLLAGSFVRVVKDSDESELFLDTNSSTTETWDDATAGSLAVSYMVQKAGYEPIGPISVTVTGGVGTGVQTVAITQVPARWYVASSGLTLNTNAFANATTKLFGLTVASTLQNFASYLMEQWITLGGTGGAFANKPWPLAANGPNSFTWLNGWEADTAYPNTLDNFSRDGMRYLDTNSVMTAQWAAILTSGVPSGARVRFQQTDGGTTQEAAVASGDMDQLVQVYGDASHGNFDRRGYLVLKVQEAGYDQAEADVVATYGNLEDQLYVVGLAPTANGVATGDPALTITITDHGATPVTWNGKDFSITITDNATPSSGTDILRELRYNFEAGGTYQGTDAFNWHDLVQTNGSAFKTVRGKVYGDTGAALKGVRVVKNDGTTAHPDFTLFTADDGTTYSPPVTADVSITGLVNAGAVPTRLQIINTTALSASAWVANTAYATGDMVLRTSGIGTESTAGLYFRATTGGTSHAVTEPTWNTTPGGTTSDGTVTWTTYKVLFYDDDPAATSYTTTYIDGEEFAAGESVEVRFAEMNGGTTFKTANSTAITATSGFSIAMATEADGPFAIIGVDGTTQESTFSPNYSNDRLVLDSDTDFAGAGGYAYYCYLLTTSEGMYNFWDGVTALDEGNFRINTATLDMYFDCSSGFVKQTDNVRWFRDDGLRPALDPVTAVGGGIEINWRVPVNVVTTGGSALTPTESAYLLALPSAASTATAVHDEVIEGGKTFRQITRINSAVLAGTVSGAGTGTEVFKGVDGTTDRVTATVDADGNRTAVTLDGT